MTVIGFDYDGTLVESWTSTSLPGVRERLHALPRGTRTFIATNQAGPVFRAVLNDEKYPTVADVAVRIVDGLAALAWWPKLLLICVHPGKDGVDWRRAVIGVQLDLLDALRSWGLHATVYHRANYRKPQPGMLIDADAYFEHSHSHSGLVYIGDMDSDEAAARAGGFRYLDAADWRSGTSVL